MASFRSMQWCYNKRGGTVCQDRTAEDSAQLLRPGLTESVVGSGGCSGARDPVINQFAPRPPGLRWIVVMADPVSPSHNGRNDLVRPRWTA